MAKNNSTKGIIMQGIGKALSKGINIAPYEYSQMFQAKRLPRAAHADAFYYLLALYSQELEKEKYSAVKIQKLLIFMLYSLNEYTNEPNMPVELYTDMKKIRMYYDEFKSKNEKYKNENIEELVLAFDEMLTSLRPELSSEDISLAQKIKEKLDIAHKDLEDKDKEIERLKSEYDKLIKDNKKDESYKDRYEELKKEISKLNEQIKKIEKENNKEILHKNEEIDNLNKDIEQLNKTIDELKKTLNTIENNNKINEQLISLIFELISKGYTVNSMIKELERNGYYISLDELHKQINKSGLSIVKGNFNNNIFSYTFNKNLITNQDIPIGVPNVTNFLFISQPNIELNNEEIYTLMDKIYTYCIDHNIYYIFTLGNLFKIDIPDNITYSYIKSFDKTINEFLKNYPKDPSITNVVLGGNSEKFLNNYGYKVQDIISKERYDFYNAGHKSATIKINGGTIYINMHTLDKENTISHINSYYLQKGIENYQSLDIISKKVITQVDTTNRIVTIPPLLSENNGCSIYHVETTVQDGEFKKFTILPIMVEELTPTSKILLYK